jgi:hypothetical protein
MWWAGVDASRPRRARRRRHGRPGVVAAPGRSQFTRLTGDPRHALRTPSRIGAGRTGARRRCTARPWDAVAMDVGGSARRDADVPRYVRPTLPAKSFADERGRPIAYGRARRVVPSAHWPRGGANDFNDQERYAPIGTVAHALVTFLETTFEVAVDKDVPPSPFAFFPILRSADPERLVHVRPAFDDQAPIIIAIGGQPGRLDVYAGCFSSFDMWFCGCDACDEPWEDTADWLENAILSVAAGELRERISHRPFARARFQLGGDASRLARGVHPVGNVDPGVLRETRNTLDSLPDGTWQPYSLRQGGTVVNVQSSAI